MRVVRNLEQKAAEKGGKNLCILTAAAVEEKKRKQCIAHGLDFHARPPEGGYITWWVRVRVYYAYNNNVQPGYCGIWARDRVYLAVDLVYSAHRCCCIRSALLWLTSHHDLSRCSWPNKAANGYFASLITHFNVLVPVRLRALCERRMTKGDYAIRVYRPGVSHYAHIYFCHFYIRSWINGLFISQVKFEGNLKIKEKWFFDHSIIIIPNSKMQNWKHIACTMCFVIILNVKYQML